MRKKELERKLFQRVRSMARNSLLLLLLVFLFNLQPATTNAQPVQTVDKQVEEAVVAEDWGEAAKLLDSVNPETPSSVLRMIKGHADLALNRNNESLTLFYSITLEDMKKYSEWGESFASQNNDKSIAHYFLGDMYSRAGDLDQAHKHFSKAIELNKDNYLAWNARGVISTLRKNYDDSMKDFSRVLSIKPDFIDVNNNIAMMRINQGQGRKGAIKRFQSVIKSDPDFALAYHGLGCLELLKERTLSPEDNKNIQKALEIVPEVQDILIENEERFTDAYLEKQEESLFVVAGGNDGIGKSENREQAIEEFFKYPPSLRLTEAAVLGNVSKVRNLIAEGAPVNLQGLHGVTPLMWTLVNGSLEGVKALLDAGADPNVKADNGDTAITIAAILDDDRFLSRLLAKGGGVDQRGANHRTPIMTACIAGDVGKVNMLLNSNADLNARDSLGLTALHHAAINDQVPIIKILLKVGADPGKKDVLGLSPYDYALHQGNQTILMMFGDS